MDGAADARSLSVGHRAALPAVRSRSDLWPGVREAGEGDGHQTGAVGAAFPVATCLRRAGHRHNPPRVPGSLDRVQRAKSAPAPPGIRGLLPSEPRSLPEVEEDDPSETPAQAGRRGVGDDFDDEDNYVDHRDHGPGNDVEDSAMHTSAYDKQRLRRPRRGPRRSEPAGILVGGITGTITIIVTTTRTTRPRGIWRATR